MTSAEGRGLRTTSARTAGILIVAAGALGFLFALAAPAAADLVTPNAAEQPVSSSLDGSPPKPIESSEESEEGSSGEAAGEQPMAAEDAAPAAEAEEGAAAEAPAPAPTPLAPPPVYTPVPETVIERVSPPVADRIAEAGESEAASLGMLERARRGMREAGVVLKQVVRACQVGVGQTTGGPIVVLAVLSMVTALERRRALRARLATDEDVPEFLYAWDVIAPG